MPKRHRFFKQVLQPPRYYVANIHHGDDAT